MLAQRFGLDVVLGAVLAGMVLRSWTRNMGVDVKPLEDKLDAVGYGIFIPVFFLTSGMTLDIRAIAADPFRLLVFAGLLLARRRHAAVERGGPGRRWRRLGSDLPRRSRGPEPPA